MTTKQLTKPVTIEEYNRVLSTHDRNRRYYKYGYKIIQYHPEEKSPNGKTLCEEWEIEKDELKGGDIEFDYVRRNYNNIPYERRHPLVQNKKDIFRLLNNKIEESAKNSNIKVYQIDYEEQLDEIDDAMKTLNLEGHSTRAPRRRAAPKKRTPAVRVNVRKMF